MGVFKKGRNWYIDFYVKGRRKRKKIGPSKKLAEQVLKDVQIKIAKGEYLGIYDEKKLLFKDYAEEYAVYSKANKAPSTYNRRDKINIKHLKAAFGDRYLYEVTPSMVERYKAARLKHVSPASVNRELACLKHMFTKAIEWGHVKESPAIRVRLLKEPPGRTRYLRKEEVDALIEACPEHIRPIVITALNTGMRKSEILGLRWADVDLKDRRITLRKTKNNEIRVLPLNMTLYKELSSQYSSRKSEYVFTDTKGRPFGDVKKGFATAVKKAEIEICSGCSFERQKTDSEKPESCPDCGKKMIRQRGIEDFRFHDLRHTFGSHPVMQGVDIRTVQHLMGHKDIKMTMRYSHLSPEHVLEAMEKLDTAWTLYGHQAENVKIEKTLTI